MNLELKYLAPYLPYGLKGQFKLSEASILARGQQDELRYKTLNADNVSFFLKVCKPLLLPLSECEKHLNNADGIELDSSFLAYNPTCNSINIYPDGSEWTHSIDVYKQIYEWLFEHHFDVFGLIDADLALNKNDYPA